MDVMILAANLAVGHYYPVSLHIFVCSLVCF